MLNLQKYFKIKKKVHEYSARPILGHKPVSVSLKELMSYRIIRSLTHQN